LLTAYIHYCSYSEWIFDMQELEQAIRERAYHMWMEAGCPDGNADAFWLGAQREVLAASLASIALRRSAERPDPIRCGV
jgi:hypothetical protein